MTKYVLNSGAVHSSKDRGTAFFKEIVASLSGPITILCCFFALPREDWDEKFLVHQRDLPSRLPNNVKPILILAMPDNFVTQVQTADVVYIHGGDDHLLQYWLKQFDVPRLWENKVVGASSAGSNALVSSYWTCDWRKCMDGLGILPIRFIAHFRSTAYTANDPRGPIDWDEAHRELEDYGDKGQPIHALEEGEFISLTV